MAHVSKPTIARHIAILVLFTLACGTTATPTFVPSDSIAPQVPTSQTSKIVFVSVRSGNDEIYVMDADGGNVVQLTNNPGGMSISPRWSPDGKRIAFLSKKDGDDFEIYVMDADGQNQIQLTNNNTLDDSPSWSPDGTRLVFGRLDEDHLLHLYVMNADGSNVVPLFGNTGGAPSWAPNKELIAFVSSRTGSTALDNELYLVNVITGDLSRVTNNSLSDYFSVWSPDGSRLLFTSYTTPEMDNAEIFVVNADGSNLTQLTFDERLDWYPDWSLDGKSIIFTKALGNPTMDLEHYAIYSMNADGSDARLIAENGFDAHWQPGGEAAVPAANVVPPEDPNSQSPDGGNRVPSMDLLVQNLCTEEGECSIWRLEMMRGDWQEEFNSVVKDYYGLSPAGYIQVVQYLGNTSIDTSYCPSTTWFGCASMHEQKARDLSPEQICYMEVVNDLLAVPPTCEMIAVLLPLPPARSLSGVEYRRDPGDPAFGQMGIWVSESEFRNAFGFLAH